MMVAPSPTAMQRALSKGLAVMINVGGLVGFNTLGNAATIEEQLCNGDLFQGLVLMSAV